MSTETGNIGAFAVTTGYAPMVGDRFHKPAGTYTNPLTGEASPTPERNAHVTAMSHDHVVVVIDGEEYTNRIGDFIRIAENTLKHGSTLTRSA